MNLYQDGDLHERPTKELLQDLMGDGRKLLREEVALAKLEVREEVKKAAASARDGALGGVLAHAAVLCLCATLIAGLATLMPIWVAGLVVTVLVGGIAGYLFVRARDEAKAIHPAKPAEQMKEDLRWTKQKISTGLSRRRVST